MSFLKRKSYSEKTEKQMTVGDLKRMLDKVPDTALVETEGCDCVGPSDGIVVRAETYLGEQGLTVLITR